MKSIKKTIITAALLSPLFVWAQDESMTVSGTVKNAGPHAKVYMKYTSWGKQELDSVIVKNGGFELKRTLSAPVAITLIYDHKGLGLSKLGKDMDKKEVFFDKGTAKVSIKDSIKNATITGSELNAEYVRYLAAISGTDARVAALDAQWKNAPEEKKKDPALFKEIRAKYDVLVVEKIGLMEKYITKNPNSYFSLTSIRDITGSIDAARFERLFGRLSVQNRQSGIGKMLAVQLADMKRTAVGTVAPDFTQNDPDGKPVKLSDFRGKYVLLDFWASWCGPCRAENPHVVKAFHKYKSKNFTVLGVSLDFQGQRTDWLNAIKADKLDWPQASDLKGWKNEAAALYSVKGIPQNFLIGPDGKILAVNLRGDKLDDKLAEILGKS